MRRSQVVVFITLGAAVALGLASAMSMQRAARRRGALVAELAAAVPPFSQARLVSPWEPAPDADMVRATYCFDGTAVPDAAARAVAALRAGGWQLDRMQRDARTEAVTIAVRRPGLELRGFTALGKRPDCQGAQRQVALIAEGVRAP